MKQLLKFQLIGALIGASLPPALYALEKMPYEINVTLNGWRDGDVINRISIVYNDTVSGGESCLWDLSNVKGGNSVRTTIKLVDDSIGCYRVSERNSALYFNQNEKSVIAMGHENPQWRLEYDQSEPWLSAITYNMAIVGALHAKGIFCERMRYALRGSYNTSCDAIGTLILPEGDTIRNVQRIHTVKTFLHNYFPIDSISGDVSPQQLNDAIAADRLIKHGIRRWYAPGYRYPILEIQTLDQPNVDSPIMLGGYYTPPSEIEALATDPENQEIRNQIKDNSLDANRPVSNVPNSNDVIKGGDDIKYTVTQNRNESTITINYSVNKNGNVEFILADVIGYLYKTGTCHTAPGQQYTVTLSYGNIPGAGPYVLYVCTDENRYSEKFYR